MTLPVLCHHLNLDCVGGVESLFVNYLAREKETAHHRLLIPNGGVHPLFEDRLSGHSEEIITSKRWKGMPLPKRPRAVRRWALRRRLKAAAPDKVIFWNSLAAEGWTALGDISYQYYDHGASWFADVSDETCSFLRGAESIACCSHAAKRMLQLRWDLTTPIHHIANPLRPQFPIASTSREGVGGGPVVLGVAGRLLPIKGMALAIHGIAELRRSGCDARLRIAGEGPDREWLMSLAQRLAVDEWVEFCGCLADMPSFYASLDFFLCPSLREPFGLVPLEAMASGCPVITTHVDGLPEVNADGKSGVSLTPELSLRDYQALGGKVNGLPECVYDPATDALITPRALSPKRIADTVLQLAEDRTLYRKLSAGAVERADTLFAFQPFCETLSTQFLDAQVANCC